MAKEPMARIELLTSMAGVHETPYGNVSFHHEKGELIDWPASEAAKLIAKKLARAAGPLAAVLTK